MLAPERGPRGAQRIFITGATGFIGAHIVRRLAQAGHEMRWRTRQPARALSLPSGRSQLIPGDVTDRRAVHEGMRGCDCVVHLANAYSFWEPDRRVYWEMNVAGTRNVLEAALDLGVSKVVRISTTLVSGKP